MNEEVLIADENDFEENFIAKFNKALLNSEFYRIEVPKNVDTKDPKTFENILIDPKVKGLLDEMDKEVEEKSEELRRNIKIIEDMKHQTEASQAEFNRLKQEFGRMK